MRKVIFILLFVPGILLSQIPRHPFYQASGPPPATDSIYTDDFEARNTGVVLQGQGHWTLEHGSGMRVHDITTNIVLFSLDADYTSVFYDQPVTTDHYSEALLTGTYSGSGKYMGVSVENQNGGGDCYMYITDHGTARLIELTNGAVTGFLDTSGGNTNLGDILRLERSGDSLICYINGARDHSIGTYGGYYDVTWTGGKPGVAGKGLDTSHYVDDWEGGDL